MKQQISTALTKAKYKNPNVFSAIALAMAVLKGDKQVQGKTRAYLASLYGALIEGDSMVGRAVNEGKVPKWQPGKEEAYRNAKAVLATQTGTLMSVITGTTFEGCNAAIEGDLQFWHAAFNDAWAEWAKSDEGRAIMAETANNGGNEVDYETGGGDFYDPRTGAAVATNAPRTADALRLAAAQAAARSAAIKKMAADSAKVAKDFAAQLKAADQAAVGDE
jgi:hypothetical protein